VSELLRANPTLQANGAQILLDTRMRDVRYTAAARAFDQRGWYIGTWGRGLLYLPDGAAIPDRLSFGLPGSMVGAVFAAPGGVWAANDRTADADAALTFVASDLSAFSTIQGPLATGMPFTQVRHILGQGTALWAGTDYGVARIEPGGRVRLFDESAGLPDGRVLSLVSRSGQIVAGTARGIVRLDDSLRVRRVAPQFSGAALAVAVSGDTVWAGTTLGLRIAVGDSAELSRPPGLDAPGLQAPVVGLEWLGDTLVALTSDQLLWRAPAGAWSLGPSLSGLLGRLRKFRAEGDGFWVAGDRGLAYARLNSPPLRPLLLGDVPGDVYDLAVDQDYLWVATSGGLVRFRLDAIRP
jgi:ligand-binding sensor domain-containing protein